MFLKKSKKSYGGKEYFTYALTQSYREEGKVKHRNIAKLGGLTPEQAERIRLVLKAQRIEDAYVGNLTDVVAKKHYRYLDVAVMNEIWRYFKLDYFFLSFPFAEAMTLNRCLEPKSKIHIKKWAEGTVLPRFQGDEYPDEFEVYRTLDKITEEEVALQKHIYKTYIELGINIESTVFYDITSSYFEGAKCILASYGYSRDHRPDRKQIVIALVITPEGYPLYWKVMRGNTPDVTTVKELLEVMKNRFGIKECLFVFDRGMVSKDNLKAFSQYNYTYVSALDKDEIRSLRLVEPELPEKLSESWEENLTAYGFHSYDNNLFYREHFHMERRYIIAYNRNLYLEQQDTRNKRMSKAQHFFATYNEELNKAQKSRNKKTTESKIEKNLRKWNLHKVISWELESIEIIVTTSKGIERTVKSFRLNYEIDDKKLEEQKQLDGFLCFLTNGTVDKVNAEQVIGHYRRKNKIEDAFREIKSYLELRPIFLTREERVKAHVTICVLGYLLLNDLEVRLSNEEHSPSGPVALELLSECKLNRIGLKGGEAYVESITEITEEQDELLDILGMQELVEKNHVNKLLENYAM